mgnify:CR=1 FL=1
MAWRLCRDYLRLADMPVTTEQTPVWVKSGESAKRLFGVVNGTTTARVRRMVDSGELIGRRVGVRGDRYVRSDSLNAFMLADADDPGAGEIA